MRELTSQGERAVAGLAARYGVSTDAVRVMLEAVRRGNGTMAQFSHPELGGRGQWMAGGLTMVGDMFNDRLKATVSGLASDLASLLAAAPLYAPERAAEGSPSPVHQANLDTWWPPELGRPGSSGGQNDSRYAVFPQVRRLAVRGGDGALRVYDTLDHAIGGVQQQQGAQPGSLEFTSQHGTFTVETLPLVGHATTAPPAPEPATVTAPADPQPAEPTAPAPAVATGTDADAVLATLDRLGDLHQRGVLTDEEFATKKAELLARL
ncbi:SHOCT domain-containing protein [Pseudofrankia sp. DC12]|uniref:SHOCT domain-containing protein n=1 Tax=Pseudofrankia sp. DC12 TaxID=683315 RepID=UPI000A8259AE|nr:SHOCT domain-containing protein [Pseudofrankia sp. DC12]